MTIQMSSRASGGGLISAPTKPMYFVIAVYLEGGGSRTTLAEMQQILSNIQEISPSARICWAPDNNFLYDSDAKEKFDFIVSRVLNHGDELGIAYGFPNSNESLASWIGKMGDWPYMYRYVEYPALHVGGTNGQPSVMESLISNNCVLPTSLVTYAANPQQMQWLHDNYGIKTCFGWAATQYNVDQLSGEGSELMPYYSHVNNPLVPTQDSVNTSDILMLNCITVNPVGSSFTSGESRWTIHPADPVTNGASQIYTINEYLNNPYRNSNSINYLSLLLDVNWILRTPDLLSAWTNIVTKFPLNSVEIIGVSEFGTIARSILANLNNQNSFTLRFTGSGQSVLSGGVTYLDDSNITYLWTETKQQRIILKEIAGQGFWTVIDFTDYTKTPVPVLPYTTAGVLQDISYVTGRSFKVAPTAALTSAEKVRIRERMSEIGFTESIPEIVDALSLYDYLDARLKALGG